MPSVGTCACSYGSTRHCDGDDLGRRSFGAGEIMTAVSAAGAVYYFNNKTDYYNFERFDVDLFDVLASILQNLVVFERMA